MPPETSREPAGDGALPGAGWNGWLIDNLTSMLIFCILRASLGAERLMHHPAGATLVALALTTPAEAV